MPGYFTDRELAQMQATQERALDKTCVIRTTPEVADNQGGTTQGTPVDVSTSCRIGVPSGDERLIGERFGQVVDIVLTLPWAMADVASETSTILVPNAVTPTDIYSIVMINREQSYGVATRLYCQRVS